MSKFATKSYFLLILYNAKLPKECILLEMSVY